jgi:surface polysaccharide O-acyltransferase-like enzyme
MTAAISPTSALDTDGPLLHVPTPRPKWMHYGDMIRILGTVAVVFGHVSDMIFFSHQPYNAPGTTDWNVALVWDSFARWAVPIYVMLSGALLLDTDRAESPSVFYRKRLARLGVPLVFWSFFFMWLDVYYTGWRATLDPAFELQNAATGWKHVYFWSQHSSWEWFKYLVFIKPQKSWALLLVGQPYMHMHFIFRIAGLYAFTPMLRIFLRHCPRKMVVASVTLVLALSSADSVANNVTGTSLSMFARFVPFLGFYLAGYLLRDPDHSWKVIFSCWAGFIGSIAALAAVTWWMVHLYVPVPDKFVTGPPSMELMFFDFLSPIRVVMALCGWVVLTTLFHRPWPKWLAKPVRFWANTTLGLYLIHPLFREIYHAGLAPACEWIEAVMPDRIFYSGFFQHHVWTWVDQLKELKVYGWGHREMKPYTGFDATIPTIWRGIPLMTGLVYVPSLIATIILMRIPYVRRITG